MEIKVHHIVIRKKKASWSSVDNGPLMKRKPGNNLWFWFYEFLMKTIYAETHLYKTAKGAARNYNRKLTPPQVFVFLSLQRALWTASYSGGRSSRRGEILQSFSFLDNHSKDFLRIVQNEERTVDQEYVNIYSKKIPMYRSTLRIFFICPQSKRSKGTSKLYCYSEKVLI